MSTSKGLYAYALPRGGWAIKYDAGRIPEALQGEYTSKAQADQAIVVYQASVRSRADSRGRG